MKQIEDAKDHFERRWGIRWTEEHEKEIANLVQKSAPARLKSSAGLERLVNGETYFFRYPFYMQVLADAMQAKAEKYTRPVFRILCAGCSTGEEAYSIVFSLLDRARRMRCGLEIVGIDLRTEAIEKARNAVYGRWSLRNMSLVQQSRFLKVLPTADWQVHEAYRSHAKFYVHNLMEPLQEQHFDALLTCNVLLYLHEDAVRAAYENLNRVAGQDSILIIAPTDPQPQLPWRMKREFAGWPVFTKNAPPPPQTLPSAPVPIAPLQKKTAPLPKRVAREKPVVADTPNMPPISKGEKRDDQELWNAWAAGKLDSASDQIRQRIFFEPEHPLWRFLNGVILWEHGWLGKAMKEIEKAHTLLSTYDPDGSIAGLCTARELQQMINFWRTQHNG